MPKLKMHVQLWALVGARRSSTVDIDPDDWEAMKGMDKDERDEYIHRNYVADYIAEEVEGWGEVIEDDTQAS